MTHVECANKGNLSFFLLFVLIEGVFLILDALKVFEINFLNILSCHQFHPRMLALIFNAIWYTISKIISLFFGGKSFFLDIRATVSQRAAPCGFDLWLCWFFITWCGLFHNFCYNLDSCFDWMWKIQNFEVVTVITKLKTFLWSCLWQRVCYKPTTVMNLFSNLNNANLVGQCHSYNETPFPFLIMSFLFDKIGQRIF